MSKGHPEQNFLADRFRALREQTEMTQEGFAESIGMSYKVYQSIEAGRRWNLRMTTIFALATAHGLTLQELFAKKVPKSKLH